MKTTYYPVGHLHDFSKLSILTWNDMREFIDSLKEDTALFFDDIKMPNYVDRPTATVCMGKNNGRHFLDIVDKDIGYFGDDAHLVDFFDRKSIAFNDWWKFVVAIISL